MTFYRVLDDIEAGAPCKWRDEFRDHLPSTVPLFHDNVKGAIQLTEPWMQFVRDINDEAGRKYHFKNGTNDTVFRDAVGWHNMGADNLVEQITFSGNIVDVYEIDGYRAYIKTFYINDRPPSLTATPTGLVHILTTQYKDRLYVGVDKDPPVFPRTFVIARPSERLWIDVRNLARIPLESTTTPVEENKMPTCNICGTELICPNPHVPVVIPDEYELWLDVYQGNGEHDWQVLKDNGVTGICGKIGYGYTNSGGSSGCFKDSKFRTNAVGALKTGLKYAGYWWTHPLEDWNRQIKTVVDQCKDIPLEFIANDMEQTDGFGKVYDKKKKKWVTQHITKIPASQISNAGQFITEGLDKAFDIPILTYTRNSFITEFAPQMLTWMKNYGYWICQVPFERVFTYIKAEAELKNYTYCPTWKEYLDKYAPKPESPVYLPNGISAWKIWQFSIDHVKLPGSESYMDLNWLKR